MIAFLESTASGAKQFLQSVLGNWASFVLYAALSTVILLPYTIDDRGGIYWGIQLVAFGLVCVAMISRRIFAFAALLTVFVTVIHLHLDHHWGADQLDSRIEAILESPPAEAREYLQSHVATYDLVVLLLACILVVLIIRIAKRPVADKKYVVILGFLGICAWLPVAAALDVTSAMKNTPIVRLPVTYASALERFRLLDQRQAKLSEIPLPSPTCSVPYEKIILVLGESLNSDHIGAFGYSKNTTPFISRSDAALFSSLAPSNQTRFALAMMLTNAHPEDFDLFYKSHSVIREFDVCGYSSTWVSNQGRIGLFDSFSSSLAKESDEQIFLNELSYREATHDGEILRVIEDEGIHRKDKSLTIIHMIGSHTRYENRYPEGFGNTGADSVIDIYDNSVLYTDYVLSEIYRMFGSEKTLIIFAADHGQVVSENRFGSGFSPAYREEYRAPLIVWGARPHDVERIRGILAGRQLNLASLPEFIRFLSGLSDNPGISTSRLVLELGTKSPSLRSYDDLREFSAAQ